MMEKGQDGGLLHLLVLFLVLIWFLRRDVPVLPQIAPDCQRPIRVLGEHPGWCPAVDEGGVNRVAAVRVPDWHKMRPATA